ncbi:MAG: dihydrofolate reductase [Rikenellaceae bacterium]
MKNRVQETTIDRFDDIKILRFEVPGFDELSLTQKRLIYHLSQAALYGRDIFTDQNFKYNLIIRKSLEKIYLSEACDKSTSEFEALEVYLKKVWFSSGIHHHYSGEKFIPAFSRSYFIAQAKLANIGNETIEICVDVLFSDKYGQRCAQQGDDLLASSASNYYINVTQKEAEEFYAKLLEAGNQERPLSYGLNSRLVKQQGSIKELVYKTDGEYGELISKIVQQLDASLRFAQNLVQSNVIKLLIEYYKSGDLELFDKYNIEWLKETQSDVDFINGFIEVYGDPLGYKASWEANVNIKDIEATKQTQIISDNAQWFEDNSPIDDCYKKKEVKGVCARVISVAILGGDCYPASPLGINLPNSDWIRKEYGSKSVTIKNISDAHAKASLGDGVLEEFMVDDSAIELAKKYGSLASNLHTDLHECLGHGSGQLAQGVIGDELRNYGSPIEEARADLFALYYMGDEKLVELGVMPSMDVMKAAYNSYMFNGLMGQLSRIELGKDIMQAHMRNRQMIARWCLERGAKDRVVSIEKSGDKSYVVINDYQALRAIFAELLNNIQHIKSSGDYMSARDLIENYGVKVNKELHNEVKSRYKRLNLAPYSGFVNPSFSEVFDSSGNVVDIKIDYTATYVGQMLEYSSKYSL